jgi:diphthine-ammonia ligase
MAKKVAVLFSGGKDSALALHKVLKDNDFEVKYLLSIIPENPDSYMFHKPYQNLLNKQAEMLDIDLIIGGSKGEKEKELVDLRKLIESVKDEIDSIVVGGIASDYQGSRVKKICDDLGLDFVAPILGYKPEDVWKELLDEGFKVILTKIACEGLDENFIGKVIDDKLFDGIKVRSEKYKFRIDFEGGEAESAVLYMPEFSGEIRINYNVISQGRYNFVLDIKSIK